MLSLQLWTHRNHLVINNNQVLQTDFPNSENKVHQNHVIRFCMRFGHSARNTFLKLATERTPGTQWTLQRNESWDWIGHNLCEVLFKGIYLSKQSNSHLWLFLKEIGKFKRNNNKDVWEIFIKFLVVYLTLGSCRSPTKVCGDDFYSTTRNYRASL